jgi:hypothetical protein
MSPKESILWKTPVRESIQVQAAPRESLIVKKNQSVVSAVGNAIESFPAAVIVKPLTRRRISRFSSESRPQL